MPRRIENLPYNAGQYLDLHLADEVGRPLVVCIHGGGFISGSRLDERCRQSAELLTGAEFNCACIGYTLAPAEDRFAAWPRNLFDVADALAFLSDQAAEHGYDFSRLGMLGYSAGCCLSNLYIQGGENIFDHFGYPTPVFRPAALVGFYGPYDFTRRQPERQSTSHEVNLYHSPAYWLRQNPNNTAPPVLHFQGDKDDIVYPDQHAAFQQDYERAGHSFKAVIVEGFAHAFAPKDANPAGKSIDLGSEILAFYSRHL